jgi:long-chain acyl-CoA synthetase
MNLATVSGGSALPVELLHEFESAFGCVVLEDYGLSETSAVACFASPQARQYRHPIDGVRVRVIEARGSRSVRPPRPATCPHP